jgi:hypothetical protein
MSLGEQLENHALPHRGGVQHQATSGLAGDNCRTSQSCRHATTTGRDKLVKYDHVDQKMSASVQCHLELGFSFKTKSMLDSSTHDHAMHACKLRL